MKFRKIKDSTFYPGFMMSEFSKIFEKLKKDTIEDFDFLSFLYHFSHIYKIGEKFIVFFLNLLI